MVVAIPAKFYEFLTFMLQAGVLRDGAASVEMEYLKAALLYLPPASATARSLADGDMLRPVT